MEDLKEYMYINELLLIYGKTLTTRQLKIMEDYYKYNLGVQEIADELNISKAAVSDAIKVSTRHLENLESIVGHYAYRQKVKALHDELKEMTLDDKVKERLTKEEDDGI
ncbi:MAG: sigma factor-like helix-turn-helix DNA-binding protein [Bacilli bacterium]|jgi:predicted DNA-binding protein YlxM (UPF0122 family)